MMLRVNLSVWGEDGKLEDIEPVQALFDRVITDETIKTAQLLMAEALERRARKLRIRQGNGTGQQANR